MAERGVDVSYETIHSGINSFGPIFAKRIRSRSQRPSPRWHLDEVYIKINGKVVYLWCAVDDKGGVLDIVVQSRRNKTSTMKLLRKLLKSGGVKSERIMTDLLRSYSASLKDLNCNIYDAGGRKNTRLKLSSAHLAKRTKAQNFRSMGLCPAASAYRFGKSRR